MKKAAAVEGNRPGDLEGLPTIGPVRREALAVAGITTRAELARASVEQIVSITGMQRVYATRVLEIVRAEIPNFQSTAVTDLTDENQPGDDTGDPSDIGSEPSAPEPEPPFELDRAIFRATTAVADASRKIPDSSSLMRQLLRLATLLERLPQLTENSSKKRKARIAERLNQVTERLEKSAMSEAPLKPNASERLKDSIKADHERIDAALPRKTSGKRKSKK